MTPKPLGLWRVAACHLPTWPPVRGPAVPRIAPVAKPRLVTLLWYLVVPTRISGGFAALESSSSVDKFPARIGIHEAVPHELILLGDGGTAQRSPSAGPQSTHILHSTVLHRLCMWDCGMPMIVVSLDQGRG